MAEARISPYSLADLKNTTDDALGNYLRSIGFQQDHSKTDVKLLLGYAAVIIAGATFAADYKLGWDATKHWTAVAVVAYMILNGAFSYWLWFVEGGLVFEGSSKGKKVSWNGSSTHVWVEANVQHLDRHILKDQQARTYLLPHRKSTHLNRLSRNPSTFHNMVHSRRLLRRQTLSAMASKQRRSSRRHRFKERHARSEGRVSSTKRAL
jgi:hypothetical protein